MGKKKHKQSNIVSPKTTEKINNVQNRTQISHDLFSTIEGFFAKRQQYFLYLGMLFVAFFSLLLFNPQIYETGDDTAYIERAYHFIKEGNFPTFQGSLYPIVLGIFIKFFGIKVILLKFLSLLFGVGAFYFFFKAFKEKIPYFILCCTALIISVSYDLLFYNSQTLSEAFFTFMQALFLYVFLQKTSIDKEDISFKQDWKKFLIFGLCIFLLSITKNVAYIVIAPLIIYFVIQRKWKPLGYTLFFYIIFFVLYTIVQKTFFHIENLGLAVKGYLAKDYYNPDAGMENFSGFLNRFFVNLNNYFNYYYECVNFRGRFQEIPPSIFLTCLLLILAILAIFFSLKRKEKNIILFTVLYLAAMYTVTFLILQVMWRDGRLVIVYFPYVLLISLMALYYIFNQNKLKKLQWIFLVFIGIMFITTLQKSVSKIQDNQENLLEFMSGNDLYSYTPDWRNFLEASRWAAKNTPDNIKIASRKSSMSFIISGQDKFYGIYRIPSIEKDDIIKNIDTTTNILYLCSFENADIPDILRPNIAAEILIYANEQKEKSNFLFLCSVPNTDAPKIEHYFSSNHIVYTKKFNDWYITNRAQNPVFYSPDSLLNDLKKAEVEYILLAKLLINPLDPNDNRIISTVHRYLYYIQEKYPNVIGNTPVYSIGNQREGSLIYKINYPQ